MDMRHGTVRRWRAAIALGLVSLLALAAGPVASAQDASPAAEVEALDVVVMTQDGEESGVLSFVQVDGLDAVRITGELQNLEPGDHGLHIHAVGTCDPAGDEPFSSAGGHFNPTGAQHGPGPMVGQAPVATPMGDMGGAHAGDLGNITANDDGVAAVDITSDRITLVAGEANSLDDADGSAIVVHQDADDLETDPSGNSGPRIACGVIFAGTGATPVAVNARD
jgi:superoxide dismutase, Cu-Zn family